MKGSIIIVGFFVAGVLCGLFRWIPPEWVTHSNISFYALCGLMFCVGIGVGNDPQTLKNFRALNPRLVFLPIMTVLGTLAGSAAVSLLLTGRSLADCLAVGAGFGYYSLSSIFITEYKGAEMGTIALLANICREILTLLAAPLMVRWCGKLAPISAGGATTMDTTLPIITRTSGQEFVVVSIFHGFVVDFSVPFLVTLFCSI
ncbi:MAG: lysine exporter LysO family protein [Bacteroides sp.]|nr:lysine exporter LysO family protein [Bacteroides sp.]